MRDTTKAIERIRIEICKLWEAIADINKHQSQVEPHAGPKPEPAKEPIADCDNCKHRCTKSNIDYCQMYEPKPEPAKEQFEVGDWVEYRLDGDTYYGKICNIRGYMYSLSVTTEEIPKDQARAIMLESIIRKLSPREVIVHIGCLSGTVSSQNDICFTLKSKLGLAVIQFAMLDTRTRELVESLLEAMRGDE